MRTIVSTIEVSFLGEEWDVEVVFNYTAGHPVLAPSLTSPGEPPEPSEIEIISAIVSGHETPAWLSSQLSNFIAEEEYEQLEQIASEEEN